MCVAEEDLTKFNQHSIEYIWFNFKLIISALRRIVSETFDSYLNQRMYVKGDFS